MKTMRIIGCLLLVLPPWGGAARGEDTLPEVLEFRALPSASSLKLFTTAIGLGKGEVTVQFRTDAQGRPVVSLEKGAYKEAEQKLDTRPEGEILSTLVEKESCTFHATHLRRGAKRAGSVTMEDLFTSRLEKTKDDWSGKEISQLVSQEFPPAERSNKTTAQAPTETTRATPKERVDQLVVEAPVHDLLSLLYTMRFCGNKTLDRFYFHAKDLLTTLHVGPPQEETLRVSLIDPQTREWLRVSGDHPEIVLRAVRYVSRVDEQELFRFWVHQQEPRVPLKIEFQGSQLLLNRVYHPKGSALPSAHSPWAAKELPYAK